jgi:hypothetical protein
MVCCAEKTCQQMLLGQLFAMVKAKYLLDYGLIKDQIDRLLESVPNKLEREWAAPTHPAFLVLL